MKASTILLSALLFWSASACAQTTVVTMDGVTLAKRNASTAPNGNQLMEFVAANESFENWTRLVGFRYQQLNAIDNDPVKMANIVAAELQKKNPAGPPRVHTSPDKTEALIHYALWGPGDRYLEFNTWRYTRSPDGKGVYSLQLAARVTQATAPDNNTLSRLRQGWMNQATGYDMRMVLRTLSQAR